MKHEKAESNLKEIAKILDELNCNWWVEAGTCLGAIRENKFIDHDTDIDIGLTDKDKIWYIARGLLEKGFSLIHDFGTIENGYEFSWRKWGVKVDFFIFYEDLNRDILWHSAWKNKKQLFFEFPKRLFKDLKRIKFFDFEVNIPNPVEEYLKLRYGDWKEINKEWDWAKDPKCINWERSELDKKNI